MKKTAFLLSATVAMLAGTLAHASEEHVELITQKLPELKQSILSDLVIESVKASNAKDRSVAQADIDKLEQQWQAEIESGEYVLIASVVENPLAERLRAVVNESAGLYNEINIMDARGFSVGQSAVNSDIWQGEEIKYLKTYKVGPEAVFVDEIEWDRSTQSYQSQANFSIADPVTDQAIGAVSVGISMDTLME